MADTDNASSGILKWVGGIAASVITAVLIFYLTRPSPPPPPPNIIPTALNGVVADSTTHQLIRNASVRVALGDNSARQSTDTLGRYSVVLASSSPDPNMGSVDIQAPGYVAYNNSVLLRPGDNYAEIVIDALPPPPAAAPAPVAAAPAPAQPGQPTNPAQPAANVGGPNGVVNGAIASHARIILKEPPRGYSKAITTYAGVVPKQ